ncbi:MAG: phosphoribosylanthranilate isomerase [Verrucomicrobia bacterium]|nr:phosphoribosylanthranilate isomerase [Verrucomicrobiota bacterium]
MSVRVKICGITSRDDAMRAVEAGADALGFMFYAPSPRAVSARVAADIVRALPPLIAKVGVFVNSPADEVRRAIAACGLDTLQFHGDEPPEFCAQFALKVVKAFRVRDAESLKPLASFETAAWLLDSFVAGQRGGSGAKFNWDLALEAKKLGRPIVLAGGLTPENVADAVRHVQPFGVDVSSGVESAPGRKDAARMRAFIAAAKGQRGSP